MRLAVLALAVILRPDPTLTPGAVNPALTEKVLCDPSFTTKLVRHVTPAEAASIFKRYGVDATLDRYEIDHLISLELGGTNDVTNLWPQSYTTLPLNAHVKDELENRLHHLMCLPTTDPLKISLEVAQRAVATDWVAAFRTYVCGGKTTVLQKKICTTNGGLW